MTGLATRQLRGSSEQGSREVAPSESTRRVEYKEREGFCRGRWRVCGGVWAVAMGWRVSGGDS